MTTDNTADSISHPVPKTLSYKSFFHIILIIISISICYSNTLHQEWHFDDNPNIVNSREIHLKDISLDGIINSFYSHQIDGKSLYRPAARLSFALNYYFSGLNTTSYHITNICIHILTALFAYLVFFKTLTIMDKKGLIRLRKVSCQDIALLGVIFWAIHPIQTQAVTYIVQRMTSMAAMFYMMTMFFYILFRQGNNFINKTMSLCLVLLCAALAVLSKENTVMLPLGIILFELVFFNSRTKKSKFIFYGILASLTLAILSFAVFRGIHIIEKMLSLYDHRTFTMGQRLLTEPRIIIEYLFLIFCPLADFLSHESDIIKSTGLFSPVSTFFSIISLGLLVGFAIKYLMRFKLLCFAILFYFINHLVESTFIGLELYFVHRNYLPSIFLYLAMAYYLIKGMNFYNIQNKKIMQSFIIILITVLLISQGNATYLRNDIWQTEKSLMTDAIKKAPKNIRPLISLGATYLQANRYDKTIETLKKAEKIYKANKELAQSDWVSLIYYNTGIAHLKMKHNKKAIRYFLESLKYSAADWKTHINLGYLFFKEGDIKNAITSYFNAVQLRKDDAKLLNFFGRTLYEKNQINAALNTLNNAMRNNAPIEVWLNMIACHIKQGNITAAKKVFYDIKPGAPQDADMIIPYYLYKAVLFNNNMNTSNTINNIAIFLSNSGVNYCKWIKKIKENKNPWIIYPDIIPIEKSINKQYLLLMYDKKKKLNQRIDKIKGCSLKNIL